MNTEHLIHEYLDGTLSSDQQGELFAMLAADEMAREELTSQIRLQTALRKDYAAVVVPADTTAGIFSELGLPVPGASGNTVGSQGAPSMSLTQSGTPTLVQGLPTPDVVSAWDYRRILPLLILLLSFAVVYSGREVVNELLQGSTATTSAQHQFSQTIPEQSTQQSESQISQQVDQQDVGMRPTNLPVQGGSRRKSRLIQKQVGGDTSADQGRYTSQPLDNMTHVTDVRENSVLRNVVQSSIGQSEPRMRVRELPVFTPTVLPIITTLPAPLDGNVELIARSAAFRTSNPQPNLVVGPIMDQPWALGIHYRLSEDHVLGVDGGMERLPQEFTRVDYGVPTVYRQAPVIPWAGLTYRYNMNDARIFSSIVPSASVTAAWTQIGPMARAQAVLWFTPESRMSIFLGVEGSITAYPIQSTFFTTSTTQVTYGISYRF